MLRHNPTLSGSRPTDVCGLAGALLTWAVLGGGCSGLQAGLTLGSPWLPGSLLLLCIELFGAYCSHDGGMRVKASLARTFQKNS